MPRSSADTHEHVLGVARGLFYWRGIRATGVDRIAAEAEVSATTLYRLFADKDDLVAAYVEREAEHFRDWFERAIDVTSGSARQRILAVFGVVEQQADPRQCRGCPFQMALAEMPDPAVGAHRNAVALKVWVHSRLLDLTRELSTEVEVHDPEALADHLMLMMEGVYASAGAFGADGPAGRAEKLVERLLPGTHAPPAQAPAARGTKT